MPKTKDANVILITGAMSDIGRATARAFARLGYAVVLNYRCQPEAVQAFAEMLHDDGAPAALPVQADVRSRSEVAGMFEQALRAFGRVDVLVNNAGVNKDKPFLEMGDEEWRTVLATILDGTFLCSQEFARHYGGREGNIVNIGAVTALKGRKYGANYCSARAAVLALTRCMALELAPHIRVNAVTPGRIETAELRVRYQLDDLKTRARLEEDVLLERLGKPEDVAGMIAFLVHSAQYVTGQNYFVDGGLYMH
jgi:3-oxoacyl-[acyl-carrier protein] reductase